MTETRHDSIRAVEWTEQGLKLLDQRILPLRHEQVLLVDAAGVAAAIRDMVVRGAPAIGVAAAYGVVLAARARYARSAATWRQDIEQDMQRLADSRPTAVNLFWALERMRAKIHSIHASPPTPPLPQAGRAQRGGRSRRGEGLSNGSTKPIPPLPQAGEGRGEGLSSGNSPAAIGDPVPILLAEARRIHEEDIAANRRMGELGAACIQTRGLVLTHCNTGSLATGGYGTALGVIRSAYAAGKIERVYADETRPWLQGARLTAWELVQDEIPVTLIADGAAAHLMKQGGVTWAIVGSDRIAANGDVANKIGTYSLAVAARYHGVKFMVVAPTSTVDMKIKSGAEIHIENRSPDEVLSLGGQRVAAIGAQAWNPSFDVTPAGLVDVIVTEKGVVTAPNAEKMAAMMRGRS